MLWFGIEFWIVPCFRTLSWWSWPCWSSCLGFTPSSTSTWAPSWTWTLTWTKEPERPQRNLRGWRLRYNWRVFYSNKSSQCPSGLRRTRWFGFAVQLLLDILQMVILSYWIPYMAFRSLRSALQIRISSINIFFSIPVLPLFFYLPWILEIFLGFFFQYFFLFFFFTFTQLRISKT